MPLLETKGAASAQGFGEFAKSGVANYIEDVFQTWLYTGNSTTGGSQTITNNIDLSTKGGLVWIKGRSAASDHIFTDTARGAGVSATNNNAISSNSTNPEDLNGSTYDYLSAFSTTGFTVIQGGDVTGRRGTNYNAVTYASWTFRKQPKFFDIVTYTGTGVARTISHNLGSVPGCIIVKDLTSSRNWNVYHRSLGNTKRILLNDTSAELTGTTEWNSTTPTATEFSLGTSAQVNANGNSYVAYLFAHDAGGFGLAGTDNVISCGSFVHTSPNVPSITLGYEPQWVIIKNVTGTGSWLMFDNMRGMPVGSNDPELYANSSDAESNTLDWISPNATGFTLPYFPSVASNTFIYIAIRRGPMKVPTDATKVYSTVVTSGTGTTSQTINPGFTPDSVILRVNITLGSSTAYRHRWYDRLRGNGNRLVTAGDNAEAIQPNWNSFTNNMSFVVSPNGNDGEDNSVGTNNNVNHFLRRAPGFFDEVCFTSTGGGASGTQTHNLGVSPELLIVKSRSSVNNWTTYSSQLTSWNYQLKLNLTDAQSNTGVTTTVTATNFSVGAGLLPFSATCVAYLFATCAGVSKVGSYTGTGNTLQIDCGFTGGARFVLIKRINSTGDWYYWDSARGIVAGNDPYLRLNDDIQQVTTTDWVDTHSPGFELSNAAGNNVNINTATYIFLAIA